MTVGRVVIVGGGLAGLRTAEKLRRLGHTGPVTLVGGEVGHAYDRPPLSKALLVTKDQPAPVLLRPVEKYAELDLDVRLGVHATGLDTGAATISLDDGTELGYDRLVVATGARARTVPDWEGFANVHVLRSWDDCLSLRASLDTARHVTVVGAGVLGCEIAASARGLGKEVALVEGLPTPMVRVLGPRLGEAAGRLHRSHGVDLRLGTTVQRMDGDDRVGTVVTGDGESVSTDVVVVAIGSVADTGWLEGSSVVVDDGVVCDATGASSVPGVYAVGDAARMPHPGSTGTVRLEHWTSAGDTAALVAANLLAEPGEEKTLTDVPYFWSDQYDVKIQALGLPTGDDDIVVATGNPDEHRFLALSSRAGIVTAATAMSMPAALARCRAAVVAGTPVTTLLEQAPWERKKATT